MLGTASVNSWATMSFWVEELQADVAMLQETKAPLGGAGGGAGASQGCRLGRSLGGGRARGPRGPASGGVAVLVRDGRRVARAPSAGRHPQRWIHCVVEVAEGRPLHVATVYGFDVGQPGAHALLSATS